MPHPRLLSKRNVPKTFYTWLKFREHPDRMVRFGALGESIMEKTVVSPGRWSPADLVALVRSLCIRGTTVHIFVEFVEEDASIELDRDSEFFRIAIRYPGATSRRFVEPLIQQPEGASANYFPAVSASPQGVLYLERAPMAGAPGELLVGGLGGTL